jgi:CheY-like chemotaxis protein
MNHTVLVVEDEDELRDMIREALELNGYQVVAVPEGREALDAMDRVEHVCLVLLDLLMPGMNGWDFFAELCRRPQHAHVPVVVHSSMPNRAPAGVARVIRKPIVLERLLSLVAEYCDKSSP